MLLLLVPASAAKAAPQDVLLRWAVAAGPRSELVLLLLLVPASAAKAATTMFTLRKASLMTGSGPAVRVVSSLPSRLPCAVPRF